MGDVMNLIVITAALSSLNAGLYSTGRVIRTMAHAGSAPQALGRMNSRGGPFGGIVLTSLVVVIGVIINYVAPGRAFDIAMNMTSVTLVLTWGAMIVAQMRMQKKAERGEFERPSFRMPLAPYSNWLTLAFLLLVVVLVASGDSIGLWTIIISIPIILVVWFSWRWVKPSVIRRRFHPLGKRIRGGGRGRLLCRDVMLRPWWLLWSWVSGSQLYKRRETYLSILVRAL